ncbi:M14 family metallopeptidase [Alteromonas sp. ASW11-19]|uniref:M14 family metallopeptidase n=1 Tax=Alteromonas salexigens TaxID=2982530 RepID=A0ABT2VJV2_9ALTE|nr:M14 metallopeptidase family protein [Alteromonas salexigens]MCU7553535.1 M14 family metallopeptidase [Alteromonas salexigens]
MTYPFTKAARRARHLFLTSLILLFSASGTAVSLVPADTGGKPVADYLPAGTQFNSAIPTPEEVLGAQVGEWHVRHDQLVTYMRALAEASERVTLEETGRTHENRPLLLLTITAPDNQSNIKQIQQQHMQAWQSGESRDDSAPLIFYMGYSIHGNEPSGSNAALVIAYYLAAAESEQVTSLLNNNVVLLDPSFNPDGLSRFAQWANMHKGKQLVSDPNTREHSEGWPSGRTNHYWFDLNRDWLLLTHPESRARISQFHQWRPHVLTDFHEMGTNSTYFFQPGVRSRKNPITPDGNVTLTEAIAEYHAKAFDAQGELYFSEESFDDFYVGKGSTYPDVHGSIGILFEQASSRGHRQDSINGELAFAQTIQNHVTTSLSTFEGALANKPALLDYQSNFVKKTRQAAKNDKTAGYLLAAPADSGRFTAMLDLLKRHQINYNVVSRNVSVNGTDFTANQAIYIPVEQAQYRLIDSLFSTQQNFENNTFYDVSNWNLPLAFNIDYEKVDRGDSRKVKTAANAQLTLAKAPDALPEDAYAYAIEWHFYQAPAMLQALLEEGASVRTAGKAFTARLADGTGKDFAPGTLLLPTGLSQPDNLVALLSDYADTLSLPVHALASGLTSRGADLGSRNMAPVTTPKVLLVGGVGTSQYEVGEIWHYLDTRVGLPASLVELSRLEEVKLAEYTHIIFASGRYAGIDEDILSNISHWVDNGGVLIGQRSALRLFTEQAWLDAEIVADDVIDEAFATDQLQYGDKDDLYAKKLIAGSVYQSRIDTTHPLFFGYDDSLLPVFKTSNMIVKSDNSPFTTVARYTESPLMAGYSAPELVKMIGGTTAVLAQRVGDGLVIGFTDNPHFRGYWYGTSKLMSNAIYQSALID